MNDFIIDFASYGEKVTMKLHPDKLLMINIVNKMSMVEEQACRLISDIAAIGIELEKVQQFGPTMYNIVIRDLANNRVSLWFTWDR